MNRTKKLSLRSLFHSLGNKHFISILGSGVIREILKELLTQEEFSFKSRERIKKAIEGLERIEEESQEADRLLTKIKDIVYTEINPDEIMIEG